MTTRGHDGAVGASHALSRLLAHLVSSGCYTAAVGLVADGEEVLWLEGRRQGGDGVAALDLDCRFDLASLTKPWVGTLALVLEESGRLPLATRVGDVIGGVPQRLATLSLEQLLRHRSGLAPWLPLYELSDGLELLELLGQEKWHGREMETYSDLNYIAYGRVAEVNEGESLATLLERHVTGPLEAARVSLPHGDDLPSPLDSRREVELAAELGLSIATLPPPTSGQVQDGNARYLGGVPGHAGLFGDVGGLYALLRAWLRSGVLVSEEIKARALGGEGDYAVGWQHARAANAIGASFDEAALGHVGFTGGSAWGRLSDGAVSILLGYRSALSAEASTARREFHRLSAVAALGPPGG